MPQTICATALHRWIAETTHELADILALVEAGIDFSDEPGVTFIAPVAVHERLGRISQRIAELHYHAVRWERLNVMPTVVLIGRPNVGKSSLINALTGQGRAIVSPVAGTTRDRLAATMPTPDGPIQLLDVAGAEPPTDDLGKQMQASRHTALRDADLVLQIVDAQDTKETIMELCVELYGLGLPDPHIVRNKCDLPSVPGADETGFIRVSARTGEGLPHLRALIRANLTRQTPLKAEHSLTLNERHRTLLWESHAALTVAIQHVADDNAVPFAQIARPELLAADLRHALDLLGEISGAISPDDVLGRIFSSFCIGK